MRLWSIHPQYLDAKGLVALWREGLLAQKVLLGKTKGYKNHPQLVRFKESKRPLIFIGSYLFEVALEAKRRGYRFDERKIVKRSRGRNYLRITTGQLSFERKHLKSKLIKRDPKSLKRFASEIRTKPHPLFRVVRGPVAEWEKL